MKSDSSTRPNSFFCEVIIIDIIHRNNPPSKLVLGSKLVEK